MNCKWIRCLKKKKVGCIVELIMELWMKFPAKSCTKSLPSQLNSFLHIQDKISHTLRKIEYGKSSKERDEGGVSSHSTSQIYEHFYVSFFLPLFRYIHVEIRKSFGFRFDWKPSHLNANRTFLHWLPWNIFSLHHCFLAEHVWILRHTPKIHFDFELEKPKRMIYCAR